METTESTEPRQGEEPDREPTETPAGDAGQSGAPSQPGLGQLAAADPPPEHDRELPKPHRLGRKPSNLAGRYMVIVHPASAAGDDHPFGEIGWFKANDDDHAKRQAVADAEAGHQPALQQAIEETGVLLRAVPARSWPDTKPTRYSRPEPRLEIG